MQGPWEGISPGCGPPETEMENMLTVYDGAADGGGFAANEEACPSQEEERSISRDKEA